jgi:serine/alanine adding enzyme
MSRAYGRTPQHQSFSRAAVDDHGTIYAMLSSVLVKTLPGLASHLASRAIMYSEPICVDTPLGYEALGTLLHAHDRHMSNRAIFSEVRLLSDAAGGKVYDSHGYQKVDFLNYIVDLRRNESELWKAIGKSTRGKIKRSGRRGVTIEQDASQTGVRRAYAMIRKSHTRSGVPIVDQALFMSVLEELPNSLQVRLATHQGRDVAGTLGLQFGDRYYAWYGGTTRPHGLDPFACLVWDEIQQGHRSGLRWYDFGGAGSPQKVFGPREFKSRFHGQLTEYGRYRKVYSPRKLALAERGYQSLVAIRKTMRS